MKHYSKSNRLPHQPGVLEGRGQAPLQRVGPDLYTAILNDQRELDPVKRYATHDYDSVLELYYAKARFYDAHDRRFTAADPILDPSGYDLREYVENPVQLVQYLYVGNEPLDYIDPLGLCFFDKDGNWRHDNWEFNGNYQIKSDPKNKVLRQGSRGYEVEELQKLLVKYGYLTSYAEVDGSFGPKTLQAVKDFQSRNGLEIDGSVGPKTWKAFFSGYDAIMIKAQKVFNAQNMMNIFEHQVNLYMKKFECLEQIKEPHENEPLAYIHYEENGDARTAVVYGDFKGLSFEYGLSAGEEEAIKKWGNPNLSNISHGPELTLFELDAGVISAEMDGKLGGFGVDVIHAEGGISASYDHATAGALAELAGFQGTVKIPIPLRIMLLLLQEI